MFGSSVHEVHEEHFHLQVEEKRRADADTGDAIAKALEGKINRKVPTHTHLVCLVNLSNVDTFRLCTMGHWVHLCHLSPGYCIVIGSYFTDFRIKQCYSFITEVTCACVRLETYICTSP